LGFKPVNNNVESTTSFVFFESFGEIFRNFFRTLNIIIYSSVFLVYWELASLSLELGRLTANQSLFACDVMGVHFKFT